MRKTILVHQYVFVKLVLGLLVILFLAILLRSLTLDYYPDFSSYYYGVSNLLKGGNPYLVSEHMIGRFLYPPSAVFFFIPFTFFSYAIAEKILVVLSLGCFFASIAILFKLFKLKLNSILGLIILICLFNYFPEKFTLGMGQFNNVILLLLTLFLYFYMKGKEISAGLFITIAVSFKIFPILIFVYLFIQKRWKILGASFVSSLFLLVVVLLFIDRSVNLYFLQTVIPELLNSQPDAYYNQSITGFLTRLQLEATITQLVSSILTVGLLVISTVFCFIHRNSSQSIKLISMGNFLVLNLIAHSLAWQHHFVWMIIPLFITLSYIREKKLGAPYYLVLALSFILIAYNIKDPQSVPILLQSHVLYGALILYLLHIYIMVTKNKLKNIKI